MKILVLGIFLFSLISLGECKSNYIIKQEQYMPLYILIAENKVDEAINYMADKNIPLETIIRGTHSVIAVAAHFCRPRLVDYLLNHGVFLDNEQSSHLLYTALEAGCVRVFWYLVGHGKVDFGYKDEAGGNLLDAAARGSSLTEFKFLVNQGLNYRIKDKSGLTIYCALESNNKENSSEIRKFLAKNYPEGRVNCRLR